MQNLMIDLETWGNTPAAAVIQVAGIYFDPKTKKLGKQFNMHIDAQSEMDEGFNVNADTLYWWFNQSGLAQVSAIGDKHDRVLTSGMSSTCSAKVQKTSGHTPHLTQP